MQDLRGGNAGRLSAAVVERPLLLQDGAEREQQGSEDGERLTHAGKVRQDDRGERGDVTWSMPGKDSLGRRAASNLVAVEMDLAGATAEGDADRVKLLADAAVLGRARSSSTGPSCSTTRCSSATSRPPTTWR